MQSPTPGDRLINDDDVCPLSIFIYVMRRSDSSVIHGADSDARDRMQINGRAFPRVSLFSPLKYSI